MTIPVFKFAFVLVTATVDAHSYHAGTCPAVVPAPNFQIDAFLGRWYTLLKTATNVHCLTNEFSAVTDGVITLQQTMKLPLPSVNHEVRYVGRLASASDDSPAIMTATFPLNPVGAASYTVFMTDHVTYAGVYTCQSMGLWYRHSASLLARHRTVDDSVVRQFFQRLRDIGVHIDVDVIRQDCYDDGLSGGVQVDIRSPVLETGDVGTILKDVRDVVKEATGVMRTLHNVYRDLSRGSASLRLTEANGISEER